MRSTSLSMGRLPWLRGLVRLGADLASDGRDDPRAAVASLRPVAMVAVAAVIAFIIVALALLRAWNHATTTVDRRIQEITQVLTASLAEVGDEVNGLGQGATTACDEEARARLGRAGIDSALAREFLIESLQSPPYACGALGMVVPYWGGQKGPPGTLEILSVPGLQPAIVLRKIYADNARVVLINPRQLFDRVRTAVDGGEPVLLGDDGVTLVRGVFATPSDGLQLVRREQRLVGWPLRVALSLPVSVLSQYVMTLAPLLLALWVAATALTIIGANRLIAQRSSRKQRLHTALRKRRFAPVVQPIVDAETGRCLGAEVLMRWKHPVRGLVAPAEFIDYAERSGLIVPMSELLMRTARDQLADVAAAHPDMYFSFNIAPAQLRRPDFAATLLDIFDGQPIGPQQVVIELTERELADDHVRGELGRLRALGFRIAIDDFGTGHSSLALLQKLPLDRLKIDREFVRTVETGTESAPVLDAIVDLAHRLNLGMVAEGIETPAQRDYLRQRGIQALQGYLIARPLTPPDFASWVARQGGLTPGHGPVVSMCTQLDLENVMARLREHPQLLRDRWQGLRLHRNCLVGSELTRWMAQQFDLTRTQAIRLGRRLVARGWIEHVVEEHDFQDGPFLYRLPGGAAQEHAAASAALKLPENKELVAWLRGPQGVRPGRRGAGLIEHREAFSGREAVRALMRVGALDRDAAVEAGRRLLRSGAMRHAFDERGFEDTVHQHYHLA